MSIIINPAIYLLLIFSLSIDNVVGPDRNPFKLDNSLQTSMKIRTRFAPSPTGFLHIGGVRTALYSWLYARKHQGEFVLRIEDTDQQRSSQESVDAILQGMDWLGLDYDQGPIYQSQRMNRYKEVIQDLLDQDKAYYCYCTKEELESLRNQQMAAKQKPRYDGRCRHRDQGKPGISPVVRFKNPTHGAVEFDDLVRGKITVNNEELDDLIIARSDGSPTYNLTVVVDDSDMEINYVLRGDDHINNTPRQINIMRAMGVQPPSYAHMPMILGSDGSRLSKRHGAVSVLQYRDDGYLPEAVLNYLVRLGWSHGDSEIFSVEEMTEYFDLADVNRAPSTFNPEKLLWLNHHYIRTSDPEHIAEHLRWHFERLDVDPTAGPDLGKLIEAQRERCKTLLEMAQTSAFFFSDDVTYEEKSARKNLKPATAPILQRVLQDLSELSKWSGPVIQHLLVDVGESLELKFGKIAQPLRVAISGSSSSPSIDVTLELLGRDKTLQRIAAAIEYINEL